MRRYLTTIIFTIAIVGFYSYTDIRFFSLNINKTTREHLFNLRVDPEIDLDIIILNIGKKKSKDISMIVDSILQLGPRIIGINLCHNEDNQTINLLYQHNNKVVITSCKDEIPKYSQSRVIQQGNVVTHFKSDINSYFESIITKFSGRGNSIELINYGNRDHFYKSEISDWSMVKDNIKGKIILMGYMGEYLTGEVYDFNHCRITPLNKYFGEENIIPDMYDIEISANIISTINNKKFITELNIFYKCLGLLIFSLINVLLLTYLNTKWQLLNLVIAMLAFMMFCFISSVLIVYLFHFGYYMSLDELPHILLATTSFILLSNFLEKRG